MKVLEVRRLRTARGASLAAAMLIAAVALSACTGSDAPTPPPQSAPPASPGHEPIVAVVSTCTGPSGASGKTEFNVAYRMKGVTDPIHLVHVNQFAAYQGSTRVNVTP